MLRYVMLLLASVSCATHQPDYAERVDAWKGRSISEAVAALGAPSTSTQLPDGSVSYGYSRIASNGHECKTSLLADKQGVVLSTHTSGLGCY